MKYGIKLEKNQIDHPETLIGTSCDGTNFEILINGGDPEEGCYYVGCTGSFWSYLRTKHFFGKTQVGKWNW